MKKKENWALALSIIALLIGVAGCFIKIEPISYDYMGILVGVLSLLVTALIGWQIHPLIDIRNLRKEISNERTKAYIDSERNITATFIAISDYYYSTLTGKQQPENEKLYNYIYSIGFQAYYMQAELMISRLTE